MSRDSIHQVAWRTRRAAAGRKGVFDVDLMLEADPEPFDVIKSKEPGIQSSPNSVAAFFNGFDGSAPQIAPLLLPGAWTVVGKKGKPVAWAYEQEPGKDQKKEKKKKKKKRARRPEIADSSRLEDMLEARPSSSKCISQLDRSISQRSKARVRGLEIKFWKLYRKEKVNRVHARDVHIAELAANGFPWPPWDTPQGETTTETIRSPEPLRMRRPKHEDCKRDRARRQARHAAMAARCFSPDTEEHASFEPTLLSRKKLTPAQARKVLDSGIEDAGHSNVTATPLQDVEFRAAGDMTGPSAKRHCGSKAKTAKSTCLTM